ncbi:hypothetical protein [Pseudooceanicola nitratireducens]|nr:hypothetical protein [Pseudooceanicola nitratireducens]
MIALITAVAAKLGVAGLAALWILKAGLGLIALRAWKQRRTKV